MPTGEERRETIELYLYKCLRKHLTESELDILVEMSEGYSYSDIESVIKEAAQYRLIHQMKQLEFEEIKKYFENNISFANTNPETIKSIREWGQTRAVPASIRKHQ